MRYRRCSIKGHKGAVVWLTGLSGSGKSTIANQVDFILNSQGIHTYVLDGDNVRCGLNSDLGFTETDRTENVRRVGEVAKLFADAGIIVLVPLISPFRNDRDQVRAKIPPGRFVEVYVNTPLETCEERDPKSLYAKARRGELPNFTGIDSPYEPPDSPEITVSTRSTPEECAQELVNHLRQTGIIMS